MLMDVLDRDLHFRYGSQQLLVVLITFLVVIPVFLLVTILVIVGEYKEPALILTNDTSLHKLRENSSI